MRSGGNARWTLCRTSKAATRSSVRWVTTPSAPSASTAPSKLSGSCSRDSSTRSPLAVTSSMARTEEANDRWAFPEPCVPVALAPPTEMWGREPMFDSASPASAAARASSPYRTPAETRTVRAVMSKSIVAGRCSSVTSSASLAAIVEEEWRGARGRGRRGGGPRGGRAAAAGGARGGAGARSARPGPPRPGGSGCCRVGCWSGGSGRCRMSCRGTYDVPHRGRNRIDRVTELCEVVASEPVTNSFAELGAGGAGKCRRPRCGWCRYRAAGASGPGSEALVQAVVDLVGAQLLGEGAHCGVLVDDGQLEVADLGEVLPGL